MNNLKKLTQREALERALENIKNDRNPAFGMHTRRGGDTWSVTVLSDNYDDYPCYIEKRTRVLNGIEVPAPETEILENDEQEYWIITPHHRKGVSLHYWRGERYDMNALENGLWLNKEDALANAEALR